MPTITVNYEDLCDLIGKRIPIEQLSDKLFLLKCEVESISDKEINVEVTSDRPDLLSAEGIARELRGSLGLQLGLPKYGVTEGNVILKVDTTVKQIRPYMSSAVIRAVQLTGEAVRQIMQLQEKLHVTYCRRRRKVSIGVHDLDKVKLPFTYAGVEPEKISFIPLGETREMNGYEILQLTPKGREYGFIIQSFPRYPLLYDVEGNVLSLPPIINGVLTTVTQDTRNLLLDVTGTDEKLVNFVLNIVVTSLVQRNGRIESVKVIYPEKNVRTPNLEPTKIRLRTDFVNSMMGLQLARSRVAGLLRRMGYGVAQVKGNTLSVLIPPYRCDILHEIDLVEDVAIAYGYDKLEPIIPLTATMGGELEVSRLARKVRDFMVGLGFQEVMNYVMSNKTLLFTKMRIEDEKVAEVSNPTSAEYSALRNWLLPSLLNLLGYNKHVSYPQKIFECGDTVILDEEEPTKTHTRRKLAAAICDYKVSYEDIQSILYTFLKNLGVETWKVERTEHNSFIQGRVATSAVSGRRRHKACLRESSAK